MTHSPRKPIAGRFSLLRQLQRSQGTTLFEAHDDEQMQLVHLRLLDANLRREPLVTMRFRREFALAHRLDHPHLIAPLELVDGRDLSLIYRHPGKITLAELLQQESSLSTAQAFTLLLPVIEGLAQAHRHGIIHRNIRPDNIWIDGDHQGRLTGFGTARVTDMVGLTTQSVAFAISPFTAPEQLLGLDADPRSDLFSIAKVLLNALIGPDALTLSHDTHEDALATLSDPSLADILRTALAADRSQRITNIETFYNLLLVGEESHFRPLPPPPLAPCWSCGNNRTEGINRCLHCSAGPMINPEIGGTISIVLPRRPAGKHRPFLGLFRRRYAHHLTLHQQDLLLQRLRGAGLYIPDDDTPDLVDLPLHLLTDLTRSDAVRLIAFLQRQQTLTYQPEEEPFNPQGDIPIQIPQQWKKRHTFRQSQRWSMRGLQYDSPFFFSAMLVFGGLYISVLLFLLVIATSYGEFMSVPFLLGIPVIPYFLVLGFLRWRNRRPAIDLPKALANHPPLDANLLQRWTKLTSQMTPPDRSLIEELLRRTGIAEARDQPIPEIVSIEPELQLLASAPGPQDWAELQIRHEAALLDKETLHDEAMAAAAKRMTQFQQATEAASLARARIRQLISDLAHDAPGHPKSLATRPNTSSSSLENLRALHQSLLEVEDRPRFDDIDPARDDADPALDLPPRFDLIRLLASGAMAEIFLAYDHLREEQVALKIAHPHRRLDPQTRKALRREFTVAQAARHPNMGAIHEHLEVDGVDLLVLQYLPGVDLKTLIRVGGALPSIEVRSIATGLLEALATLHAKGFLHGDVKPANIIVDHQDSPRLIDFGAARQIFAAPSDDPIMGTPAFSAPELLAHKPHDERGDLFSLGRTLLEALTGDPLASIEAIADLDDKPLRALVERCLQPSPGDRFTTALQARAFLINSSSPASSKASIIENLQRCHRCDTPGIQFFDHCIRCGASSRSLRPQKRKKARQIVLSADPQRPHASGRLGPEDTARLRDILSRYANIHWRDRSDEKLQLLPVLLTPPLHADDAALLHDELQRAGLASHNLAAGTRAWLTQRSRWSSQVLQQLSPALAMLPYYLLAVLLYWLSFYIDHFSSPFVDNHNKLLLALMTLAPLGAILFLSTLYHALRDRRPVTTLSDPVDDDIIRHSWSTRLTMILRQARTTRTKSILQELATEATHLYGELASQDAGQPAIDELDHAVDVILDHTQAMIDDEEFIFSLTPSDNDGDDDNHDDNHDNNHDNNYDDLDHARQEAQSRLQQSAATVVTLTQKIRMGSQL